MNIFKVYFFIIFFSTNLLFAADPTLYDVLSDLFNFKKSNIIDSLNNIYTSNNKTILLTDGTFFIDKDVYGNIIVYDGNLILNDTSRVFGSIYYYNKKYDKIDIKKKTNYRYKSYSKPSLNFNFVYNRVQGVFLNFYYGKELYDKNIMDYIIFPYIEIGYGFSNKKLDYNFQFIRRIYKNHGFGLSIKDKIMSNDYWLYSLNENTLSSILIKEDYFDYYNRNGISIFIKGMSNSLSYLVSYNDDTYKGVKKCTNWSVFGGNKSFKENIDFPKVNLKTIFGDIYFKYNKNTTFSMSFERSFNSDYDYSILDFDIMTKYYLSFFDELLLRIKFKSSTGDLPYFQTMYLGGYNVLKAYSFKEFACSRFIYGNIEYGVKLHDFLNFGINKVILFAELGLFNKYNKEYNNFFNGFDDFVFKTDIGIGFFISNDIRLDISRRNDRSNDNLKLAVRFYNLF